MERWRSQHASHTEESSPMWARVPRSRALLISERMTGTCTAVRPAKTVDSERLKRSCSHKQGTTGTG